MRGSTSERQWDRRVIESASMLTENALEPGVIDHLMADLAAVYPGTHAVVDYGPDGLVENVWAEARVRESADDYQAYYYRLNPYPCIVEEENLLDRTEVFSRYLPRSRLWKTEYYNDFLRPLGVEYIFGMSVTLPDGARTSYSIYRGDPEGGDFTSEDVRRLDMLRPFLRNALLMRRQPGAGPGDGATVASDPALLMLDDGSVRSLNEAGDRYLHRRGTRRFEQDEVSLMRAASKVVPEAEGAFTVTETAIVRERETRLQSLFGLTPRESQVATGILRGLPYREVAEGLGISVETVRTFARSIHRKAGVNSTKRFIRLVEDLL